MCVCSINTHTHQHTHTHQLIETLVKAVKTEMSDDLFLRSDQRKPEAVLRKFKAKARGLRWALPARC